MTIEHIEVIEPGASKARIAGGDEILARRTGSIHTGPHIMSGFRRYEKLVAVSAQTAPKHTAEVRLRRTGKRPVIVGKVKVTHTIVERTQNHPAGFAEIVVIAEIMP